MIIILLPDETIPSIILTVKDVKDYHAILVYTEEALALVRTIVDTHAPSKRQSFGTIGVIAINADDAIWTLMPKTSISREQLALHLSVPADRLDGRAIALISEQHFPIVKDKIPGVEIIEPLMCGSA